MDNNDTDTLLGYLALVVGYVYLLRRKKITRRPRRWWVRPMNLNREEQGDYHNLIQEMRLTDREMFFNYTRMDVPSYDRLLRLIGPSITKKSIRTPLNPDQRLMITLRFLASGDSLQSMAFAFRIGKSTASMVIHETCEAIWAILQPQYLKPPTAHKYKRIAEEFEEKWNFPHCIGSIDGKHVRIQAPAVSGSMFYNYKDYFSIVLLAACDANYNFTLVDIGCYGSESDGGIFSRSAFGQDLEAGTFPLPPSENLTGTDICIPYFFVGDEAFGLKQYMQRPYPGKQLTITRKIFNYRLSRARRVIENAFGILVSRWRIFQRTIIGEPPLIDKIIKATVCLHNFIKYHNQNQYCPPNFIDMDNNGDVTLGNWRTDIVNESTLQNVGRLGSNNARRNDFDVRDQLANYFVTPQGSHNVPWQFDHVQRGYRNINN